jgi:hypothetical protein
MIYYDFQPTKNKLIDIDFHVAERCDYYPCKKNVIKSQQLMQIISEKYPDLILNKVANVIFCQFRIVSIYFKNIKDQNFGEEEWKKI